MNWDTIWLVAERVSVVIALIGIPYLVHERRKHRPQLAFNGSGSARETVDRDGRSVGVARFTGTVQNLSLDPNTVEYVHLVVWRTGRKNSTRRFGSIPEVLDESGRRVGPPLSLQPLESRGVTVLYETPLTGTADEALWGATSPAPAAPHLLFPRYRYEIALEDIHGNLFDSSGTPRSRKAIGLRWTVDNAWDRFKDGNPLPLVRHMAAILVEDVRFMVKRMLRAVGF